jgi:hypothetical protein
MHPLRFPKHVLDRLRAEVRTAGELGLAFLMTAGVASCGSSLGGGDGGADGAGETDGPSADHSSAIDACCIEAAFDGPTVEAAMDAGADVHTVVEAAEAGGHDGHVVVEAATEAGFEDVRPVPEAPTP